MTNSTANTLRSVNRHLPFGAIFDAARKKKELERTEELISSPDFWSQPERSQTVMQERKRLEAIRLGSISDRAQTIKYADFLNNGEDIVVQDPKFAKVYIREMAHKLELMTRGNPALRQHVIIRVLGAM